MDAKAKQKNYLPQGNDHDELSQEVYLVKVGYKLRLSQGKDQDEVSQEVY